jgi:hypothetical protein
LIKKANLRLSDALKGASQTSNFLPTSTDFVNAFKNGLVLVRVVEYLEHTVLKGINDNPKTSAAMLNNLNRALEVVRNKKGINPRYLFSSEDIVNGNPEVIIGLLEDIAKAYLCQLLWT